MEQERLEKEELNLAAEKQKVADDFNKALRNDQKRCAKEKAKVSDCCILHSSSVIFTVKELHCLQQQAEQTRGIWQF